MNEITIGEFEELLIENKVSDQVMDYIEYILGLDEDSLDNITSSVS